MNTLLINEKTFNLKQRFLRNIGLKICYFKNKFHFDFKKVDVILTWKPIPKQRNYWYLYRYKTILASFEICIIHKKSLVFFYEYSTFCYKHTQNLSTFYITEILAIQKHHLQTEMATRDSILTSYTLSNIYSKTRI